MHMRIYLLEVCCTTQVMHQPEWYRALKHFLLVYEGLRLQQLLFVLLCKNP